MHIYIYIYIYICIYIYVCMYVCVCMCVYINTVFLLERCALSSSFYSGSENYEEVDSGVIFLIRFY